MFLVNTLNLPCFMDTRLLTDHREESGIEKTPPPRTIRDDVRDNSTSTKVTSPADRAIKYRAVLPKATESRRGNINLSGVLRSERAAAISPRTIVLASFSPSCALSFSSSLLLWSLSFYYRARARYLETRSLGVRARVRARDCPSGNRPVCERCIIAWRDASRK